MKQTGRYRFRAAKSVLDWLMARDVRILQAEYISSVALVDSVTWRDVPHSALPESAVFAVCSPLELSDLRERVGQVDHRADLQRRARAVKSEAEYTAGFAATRFRP